MLVINFNLSLDCHNRRKGTAIGSTSYYYCGVSNYKVRGTAFYISCSCLKSAKIGSWSWSVVSTDGGVFRVRPVSFSILTQLKQEVHGSVGLGKSFLTCVSMCLIAEYYWSYNTIVNNSYNSKKSDVCWCVWSFRACRIMDNVCMDELE